MCQIITVLFRCPVGLARDPRCPYLQYDSNGNMATIGPYLSYRKQNDDRWICCGNHTSVCWECPNKDEKFLVKDLMECPTCEERIQKEREEAERKKADEEALNAMYANLSWVDEMIDDIYDNMQREREEQAEQEGEGGAERELERRELERVEGDLPTMTPRVDEEGEPTGDDEDNMFEFESMFE